MARAICQAAGGDPNEMTYHFTVEGREPYAPRWVNYLPQAKAAIGVPREDDVHAIKSTGLVLRVCEPSTRYADRILIVDQNDSDIAEFYHSSHDTVPQTYETALTLARAFTALTRDEKAAESEATGQEAGSYAPPAVISPIEALDRANREITRLSAIETHCVTTLEAARADLTEAARRDFQEKKGAAEIDPPIERYADPINRITAALEKIKTARAMKNY